MEYQEIEGDLIKLAQEGKFDVIAHGCNCFCSGCNCCCVCSGCI